MHFEGREASEFQDFDRILLAQIRNPHRSRVVIQPVLGVPEIVDREKFRASPLVALDVVPAKIRFGVTLVRLFHPLILLVGAQGLEPWTR